MSTVSICIGTFGDIEAWTPFAVRAINSAWDTAPHEVLWRHGDTLQNVRNGIAEEATGEWLVFLDADDTLDPGYVAGILAGTGDVRQPSTIGVHPDGSFDPAPNLIPVKRSFAEGNWIVIGAGVRRDLFLEVGGFGSEELYEDWALWWRCWLAGAEIGTAPDAIYQVHVNATGRNIRPPAVQGYWMRDIQTRLGRQHRKQRT